MLPRGVRQVLPRVLQAPVRGSSVFLLLDERVTLIDTGPRGSAERVLAAVRAAGRTVDAIEQIIITHYHADHVGNLAAIQRHAPARTGVHALEAPYVRGDRPIPLPLPRPFALEHRRVGDWLTPPARVDTVLRDGDELPVLGGLRVLHMPGHTRGHIALLLPALGLLIAGDMAQAWRGRITPPHRLYTEDRAAARQSLAELARVPFDTLALSHFPPLRRGPDGRLRRAPAGALPPP